MENNVELKSQYIIKIDNLNKSFKNKKALNDLSFKVKRGELFGFLGVNGAGKTTTLNIILGIMNKDSGSIEIDNTKIECQKDADTIKSKIGIVFQESILDENLTVKDNLLIRATLYHKYFKDKTPKDLVNEIVKKFELEDILKQKYKNLSGGQKRRVDIARALVHKPEILFLDEPTTGLDPDNRRLVWDTLKQIGQESKLTILLTTHYMEEANNCDYVIIINRAHKIAEGTPAELKQKYSKTKLSIFTSELSELDEILKSQNMNYEFNNKTYNIYFDKFKDANDFLFKNKKLINDYELKKGTMDDVFLTVVKNNGVQNA